MVLHLAVQTSKQIKVLAMLLFYKFIYSNEKELRMQLPVMICLAPDLECWKNLALNLMKLIWPADSPSPIDLCLFQLLCTSQRLIKINLAAKLARPKCFFLFCFFFLLSAEVWRTHLRLGLWENVPETQVGCREWQTQRMSRGQFALI